MRIPILFGCLALLFTSARSLAVSDPAECSVKVHHVYISPNSDCSAPLEVFKGTGEYMNLLKQPQIGQGKVPDGTYPCVMMEMSDQVRFVPSSDDGPCKGGQPYTLDICRVGTNTKNLAGDTIACTPGEDKVWLYLSTKSSYESGNDAFSPPIDSGAPGIKLHGDVLVDGGYKGDFVVDARGKVNAPPTTPNQCDMQAPVFSFVKSEAEDTK